MALMYTNYLEYMWANYTKTWLCINTSATRAISDILAILEMPDTPVIPETEA